MIPFSGLKAGFYNFAFEIDDEFFAHFEHTEITKGTLRIDCELERQQRMLVLNFTITGYAGMLCDRCAGEYDQPVDGVQRLIVKFGAEQEEEAEDILVISEKEHELYVGHIIYEYIHLLLPLKRVHGTDENGISLCDPEVLGFIRESEEHPSDPRWEALKTLKNNLEEEQENK